MESIEGESVMGEGFMARYYSVLSTSPWSETVESTSPRSISSNLPNSKILEFSSYRRRTSVIITSDTAINLVFSNCLALVKMSISAYDKGKSMFSILFSGCAARWSATASTTSLISRARGSKYKNNATSLCVLFNLNAPS